MFGFYKFTPPCGVFLPIDERRRLHGASKGRQRWPEESLRSREAWRVLLSAVLAMGFLAAAQVIFLYGASSYYCLPRLAVPDALRPAPACGQQEDQAQGGAAERWWARQPPRRAWHNMSEEEMLWVASFEPRAQHRRRPPGKPHRPKVAFMFLTRVPLPLAQLWERFFNGTGEKGRELFSVYMHTTPGYRLLKLREVFIDAETWAC